MPLVKPSGMDDTQAALLQLRHKDLLRDMQNDPPGTEGTASYSMRLGLLGKQKGVPGVSKVGVLDQDVPYIAIHNHPSGGGFTHQDVDMFAMYPNMRVLTAVGNDGKVYALSKTDRFNEPMFKIVVKRLSTEAKMIGNLRDYQKFMVKYMERMAECGVEFNA
ncbi:hypothetical protein LJC63_01560 [Ruminococcaceae bacterium OttesenSCG-928-L11]|nr:hypothetical protein [Ruminococcaceae bacterium OttesenSCG-928-L11]